MIHRLPDVVDRKGNTWSFWPWIVRSIDGRWGRGATLCAALREARSSVI